MPSAFFTKIQLRTWYLNHRLSTYAIASMSGCNPKTVYYWLRSYDISTRPRKVKAISRAELQKHYSAGLSLKKIGILFGLTPSAIYRKMAHLKLRRRTSWETNIVHRCSNFSNDGQEKAYLIGFRIGDLHVTRNTSSVIVKSNTTHKEQTELFTVLFRRYGPIWISSPKSRKNVFHCTIRLNSSFAFLVPKPTTIARWVSKSNRCFWAFLGGYVDAEGTIKIYSNRARFRIGSYDKNILKQIHQRLTFLGIKNSFRLETKADYKYQNGDFYRVDIMDRYALRNCFTLLIPYLKHPRRLHDARIALANVTARI